MLQGATSGAEPPALEAVAVEKRYANGTAALAGAQLAVARGETVALVGESGCGKTTFLRLFNRMVEPTAGEVRVEGFRIAALEPHALRRRLGYVQQDGGLIPHWTVRRNVELVPGLLGWARPARQERAEEVLALVGLPAARFGGRYPAELSGGQRQRVALARALAADPEIILLDEPFGALDALTRLELQDEFQELRRRLRKTILLVTHDLREALRLGDRVAVMQRGRVLQAGTPSEVLDRPQNGYVARLFGLLAAEGRGEIADAQP